MTSNNSDSNLRSLIRKALQRANLSMRQASLAAGMNETFVRDLLDGRTRDPGIGAVVSLANVLGVDKRELFEAVERDHGGARDNLEAAIEVLTSMTPAERTAFMLSRRRRQQP